MSKNSPHAELVGRILDRIVELSQFDRNHESWWTLVELMEPPDEQVFEDQDTAILELWELIKDDANAVAILRLSYDIMKRNNGNWPQEGDSG